MIKNITAGASLITSGIFEQGSGPVFLDEVQCSGEESQLAECSHAGFIDHICGRDVSSQHSFDVAVKCNGIIIHITYSYVFNMLL